MRNAVQIVVVCLILLTCSGLILPAVQKVRDAGARLQCSSNLKNIGMALNHYQDHKHHFPTGTLPNPDLPPEKRLSWIIEICPAYLIGCVKLDLDKSQAWDAEANCPLRWWHRVDSGPKMVEGDENVASLLRCRSNPLSNQPQLSSPTHYLGLAGVGASAAKLPLTAPRAGFFGYDRKLTRDDIKDGAATTIALIESDDGGPWTAGGQATLRGLAQDGRPYLGAGGQFVTHHSGGCVANALFADGSVRALSAGMSPELLEALATVAGDEEVGAFRIATTLRTAVQDE